MEILRKIIVISSVTEGNQVERYICDKCGGSDKNEIK